MTLGHKACLALAWLVPITGGFGGALVMRGNPGDSIPGWLCIVAALVMQSELRSMLKTLLTFHADEYRRLTGKDP